MHAREECLKREKTILLTRVSVAFITVFFPKSLSLLLTLHTFRHWQFWRSVPISSSCSPLSSSLLKPWKFLDYGSQKKRGLQKHFHGRLKIFMERENIISTFIVQGCQAAAGLLSQHCLQSSCSSSITEPPQHLHITLILLFHTAGFTLFLLPYTRRSTVCLPQENRVSKHPSLKKATIQIHVHGLTATKTFSTNLPDSLILQYEIVSGDHY